MTSLVLIDCSSMHTCPLNTFPSDTYDAITGCGIYAIDAHVPQDAIYEMIRLVKPGK